MTEAYELSSQPVAEHYSALLWLINRCDLPDKESDFEPFAHMQRVSATWLATWRAGDVGSESWRARWVFEFSTVLILYQKVLDTPWKHLEHYTEIAETRPDIASVRRMRALTTCAVVFSRFTSLGVIDVWTTALAACLTDIAQYDLMVAADEPVNIRLAGDDYRKAITSIRGAKKRRTDPAVPETCAICLDNLDEGRVWHQIGCGHRFHPHCLKTWLKKQCRLPKCPLCRYDVRADLCEFRCADE